MEEGLAHTRTQPQGLALKGMILTPQVLWLEQLLGLGCAWQ